MGADRPTEGPSFHAYGVKTFKHLKPLDGVARQPYFRETDGQLVTHVGYDKVSRRYGAFDPAAFVLGPPTKEAAHEALKELLRLLTEFSFVTDSDRSAALCAIFTAVTRPSLPHAPAFHVQAPVFGSGKTYLCELIGAFAGPKANTKLSYPTTSEEATKALLSVLLTAPSVVEFDDMDTDWIPHGTVKRMLTSEQISDRVLGVSKVATVSTRTLFLGSGNNVGPVRDLLRRVLPIHLDARTATPATIRYDGAPVEKVRRDRAYYVSLVLTIITAWQAAGAPKADVPSIASYSGAWSQYCRHPLLWLGQPDPATALLDQLQDDPDGEALHVLMCAWHAAFGSRQVTVRALVQKAYGDADLLDAISQFPVMERDKINPGKLGWLLKKHSNRIVQGLEIRRGQADGRTAWSVVCVPGTAPPQKTKQSPFEWSTARDASPASPMQDDDIPI